MYSTSLPSFTRSACLVTNVPNTVIYYSKSFSIYNILILPVNCMYRVTFRSLRKNYYFLRSAPTHLLLDYKYVTRPYSSNPFPEDARINFWSYEQIFVRPCDHAIQFSLNTYDFQFLALGYYQTSNRNTCYSWTP